MNTFKQLFTLTALSFFLLPLASLADHHHGLEDLHKHELVAIIKAQRWERAKGRFEGGLFVGLGGLALFGIGKFVFSK